MKRCLVFVFLAVFATSVTEAQPATVSVGVEAGAVALGVSEIDDLKTDVANLINEHLRSRGISPEGDHHVLLLVDARDLGAEIVVSVTRLIRLPENVIGIGAEAEAFYANVPELHADEDARRVRQYMTRSWLEQYHDILGQDLFVAPRHELANRVDDLVTAMSEAGFARM